LYLDNAKIYHAHALKAACFALNIRLLHRGVGDPPPGGLIERFFETAQGQLESEVRAGDMLTLDRLNHALAAWLQQSYHEQPNSETRQSALLKRFLHELSGPRWQPVYLHLTHLSAAGLFKLLVGKLGEPPRRGKERLFEQILAKAHQAEGGLLLILDKAHLIAPEALTDIRLLISSALDDAPPLKVVLAGQEPLRQTLRQSLHADLLNRIAVRFHLTPLTKDQTASYIDFQLKQAGGSEKLFDPTAKSLIHDYSGGVPRQINNLATACLLATAAQNAARISEAILQQTLREFQLP
jgi:general secretion pathway protein A